MRRLSIGVLFVLACGGSGGSNGITPPPPPQETPGQGTVQGQVVNEAQQGIANVNVQLTRSGATARSAVTGATGAFSFTGVDEGSWTVAAQLPSGFEAVGSLSATVNVTANQTATVPPLRMRPASPPPQEAAIVTMYDNFFDTSPLSIAVGRTVRWVNAGGQAHNTTSLTGVWSSPNINPGGSFERTFTAAGTFNYACTLHPGMNGTVVVQ
jgi:plastocyanin